MSTLDGPIWRSAALHSFAPPGHISSAHRARKDGTRVEMNVTAYQGKEENEETKKGKRKEKEKTSDRFKEAVCCPSAVIQRGSVAKK